MRRRTGTTVGCEHCARHVLDRSRAQARAGRLEACLVELLRSLSFAGEHGHVIIRPEAWARLLATRIHEALRQDGE